MKRKQPDRARVTATIPQPPTVECDRCHATLFLLADDKGKLFSRLSLDARERLIGLGLSATIDDLMEATELKIGLMEAAYFWATRDLEAPDAA